MQVLITDILQSIPTTTWPWIIAAMTTIMVIVAINPQAGDRIITFLQQIMNLFFSRRFNQKRLQSSHVNKRKRG